MDKRAEHARRYRAYAEALMRIADRLPDDDVRATARRIAREYERLGELLGDPEASLAANRDALSAYAVLLEQWSALAAELETAKPSASPAPQDREIARK